MYWVVMESHCEVQVWTAVAPPSAPHLLQYWLQRDDKLGAPLELLQAPIVPTDSPTAKRPTTKKETALVEMRIVAPGFSVERVEPYHKNG